MLRKEGINLSYTRKFQLVLFFGYLPYIIMSILAYFIFIKPSQEITQQLQGAALFQKLNELMVTLLKPPQNPNQVDASLNQLFTDQKQFTSKKDKVELDAQLQHLRLLWESTKSGATIQSQQWLQVYRDTTHAIANATGWLDNPDRVTRSVVSVLIHELPAASQERLPIVEEAIRISQADNSTYGEEPHSLQTNDALKNYKNAINQQKELFTASLQLAQRLTEQWMEALKRQKETLLWYSWGTLLPLILGFIIGIIFYMARIMRRPVNKLVNAVEEFTKGNFSARLDKMGNDEVGTMSQAFNAMADSFENRLSQATGLIQKMEQSTDAIIQSGKQLDVNFRAQEVTLKDINHQARGLWHVDQEFAENIQQLNQSTALTKQLASKGRISMRTMESIMQQMVEGSTNIVNTLASLQDKVGMIHQVIETIVKVADQSNLLSLNTAIRANQAGQQGRGFHVIADKIRNMANQIAHATLDIEQIIQHSVTGVGTSVKEVGQFSEDVLKQVNDTRAIGEELNQLIADTQIQMRNFEEIQEEIHGQTQGIEKINQSIEQLRAVAQQTTRTISQLYADIERLHTPSKSLHNTVHPR